MGREVVFQLEDVSSLLACLLAFLLTSCGDSNDVVSADPVSPDIHAYPFVHRAGSFHPWGTALAPANLYYVVLIDLAASS